MFSFRNLYVYFILGGRKKREKETVGVLCYVCTEYVHTNTLYSVSSGFCLVYLQKAETESMAITSMVGGPIPSQKALFGKRNKVHMYRVDHQWYNIKGILCRSSLYIYNPLLWHHWRSVRITYLPTCKNMYTTQVAWKRKSLLFQASLVSVLR
jgi:hypothetical protein